MVPTGSCTAVCDDTGFDNPGYYEPTIPVPMIWDCCGGTDPNVGCLMECYNSDGSPVIFPVTHLPNDDLPIMPLHTDYNNVQKTKTIIGSNVTKNLTETTAKISKIDMNKDFGKAGNMLDSFYSGGKIKKSANTSDDYVDLSGWESQSDNNFKQSEESICNAEPSKIGNLASKVASLNPTKSEKPLDKNNKIPISVGILVVGALGLGFTKKKEGYFDNYAEDLETVWNYITGGSNSSGNNSTPSTDNSSGGENNLSEGTTNYQNTTSGDTIHCAPGDNPNCHP